MEKQGVIKKGLTNPEGTRPICGCCHGARDKEAAEQSPEQTVAALAEDPKKRLSDDVADEVAQP